LVRAVAWGSIERAGALAASWPALLSTRVTHRGVGMRSGILEWGDERLAGKNSCVALATFLHLVVSYGPDNCCKLESRMDALKPTGVVY